MKNILITGATGHLGRLVIDGLLGQIPASHIFALVRDPGKAADLAEKWVTLRQGDYRDTDSLEKTMEGIDVVYLISSSDTTDRTSQHANVIEAAKKAGVKHVVYTSFDRARDTDSAVQFITQAHIDTEALLKTSGLAYTILRHGVYMDIIPDFLGSVPDIGVVFFPAGTTKVALTARADLAEWAIKILTSEGHENRTYNFVNSESYSFADIANTFSELLGKPVPYIDPGLTDFRAKLTENHVPEMYIDMGMAFATAMKDGDFVRIDHTLEKILGRKPVGMMGYLKGVYGL